MVPGEPIRVRIESLSHDGRGVAHVDGKTVLVDDALPGELVTFTYRKLRRHSDEGRVHEVIEPSPERVEPQCAHFGVCGGCSLQHLASEAQIAVKQREVLAQLRRTGSVVSEAVLAPLRGPPWGYRRKARLGVKYVSKKERVLVGFRERRSPYLADVRRCEVLVPEVGNCLEELAGLIASLDAYRHIPQIEVAAGDASIALVFRHLQPLSAADQSKLVAFGEAHAFRIFAQPGGPETVRPVGLQPDTMHYRLATFDVELCFKPTDFTQVNAHINRRMVEQAMALLRPARDERVLDLFCGIGNFTLPIARRCRSVTGVEGEPGLVQRARCNAARNGIDNALFYTADLSGELSSQPWAQRPYDKALLDPPRSGARQVLAILQRLNVRRVVYVSCNSATLATDADVLVNELGYRLSGIGVMDMFPHTTHAESMALFERT